MDGSRSNVRFNCFNLCCKRENAEAIIKHIEEMKTGRLLRYAVEAGAVLGNANNEQMTALINYSRKIGIAFQIADDILMKRVMKTSSVKP